MKNNKNNDVNSSNSPVEIRVLISDIWRGVIKFGWIALALAVLFGGIQFYRSYVRYKPEYTVSATFTVHTENAVLSGDNGVSAYSFYYNKNTADQLANVFPHVVNNSLLKNQVCNELGVKSMPAAVTAKCIADTNMVTLTAKGSDPQMTYDVLMSVINNYSSVADYIIGRTKLVMINEPDMPDGPSNTLAWRSAVLRAALIGLVIGVAWIMVYAILRKTIRTKEDIHTILNQHCVGILPQVIFKKYRRQINSDIILTNPLIGNHFLEALRLLRGSVRQCLDEKDRVVMITSTAPGEGKSVVTFNIAASFAKSGSKVLVVDCDLRDSGIDTILSGDDYGVKVTDEKKTYTVSSIEALGFDILSFKNGEDNLQEIIRTSQLKNLFEQMKQEYDLVFVDTPPCGIISDATIIAGAADTLLYVIRQDAVLQTSIRAGINSMLETEIKFAGCVLNGATGGFGGYGNYNGYSGYNKYYRGSYSRRYGYGYSKTQKTKENK
ncbi:MAG: AAA family ATPase [Clostridia bacterium]|nr:AAA family ATPase [Clostridia bacterium]